MEDWKTVSLHTWKGRRKIHLSLGWQLLLRRLKAPRKKEVRV